MVLAASGSVDLGRLLLDLLIVLVAAKLAAELAERLRVAAVLGEIAAGVLLGPSVFGLVETAGDGDLPCGIGGARLVTTLLMVT